MVCATSGTAASSQPLPGSLWGLVWAAGLTALIGGPWLAGGYIFGTDWPGPRHFDWPATASSTDPLNTALFLIAHLAGGEATGKILVLGLLFVAAAAAYAAVPVAGFVPRAAAATVYAVNPFVFGRLHYGQLFLLAGYAVLPWLAHRLRLLCYSPGPRSAVLMGTSLALVGVFTAHLFLAGCVLAAAVLYAHFVLVPREAGFGGRLGRSALLAAGTTVVLSSYWLVPFVLGRGPEASVIGGTGGGELSDYAAVPDPSLGLVPNLLGLYGFWAEKTGRFTSMKHFAPGWPLVLAAVLAVVAVGVLTASRDRRLRPWIAGLGAAAVIALYLEMGVSSPLSAGVVRWLDSVVPAYRGMRDAGKWAAVLALLYSQFFGLGAAAVIGWIRTSQGERAGTGWLTQVAIAVLLATPLYYGNGLLFGMHSEVGPSAYPTGWYAADRALAADPHPGRAVFLPWHEYMRFTFVRNQNQVIACPAPTFFSVPMLCSTNPELPGGTPPGDPDQVAISGLVNLGASGDWARVLADYNVKYVLLAREVEWRHYAFLVRQPGLTLVGDYGSIALYRDTLWRRGG